MTNEALALNSNYSLYFAMAVFTLAMVAFAVDLAGAVPRRALARDGEQVGEGAAVRERQLVGAATERQLVGAADGGPGAEDTRATTATAPAGRDAPSAAEPRRKAAGIAMMLSWLGTLLLLACIALRGLSVDRPPLGNMYEFALVGCAFIMVAFLGWSLRRDLRWLGLFVVGPVLLTLGLAITVFYTQASQLLPSLQSYWLMIHVTVATLSVALFTIGFSLTILHLIKSHREAHPPARSTFMESLPSARVLDRAAYGLHIVAFPLWTFTLIAGAVWAEVAWGHYWNWDPKEVWTFVIWVVYAAYLHARATTGWSVRRAAYLALAGYGCILVNYMVVNVYFVGQHSYSGM